MNQRKQSLQEIAILLVTIKNENKFNKSIYNKKNTNNNKSLLVAKVADYVTEFFKWHRMK
jgi:hypothetical protein